MIASAVFGIALWLQASGSSSQPRVSATDTAYLSCTYWTGKAWSERTPRSARTPVFESKQGFRAYGEVKIAVTGEDCENTTTLYVASGAGQEFKAAYTASGSDGNGIRLVGWSPDGSKLLAEVTFWEYETDRGFGHVPLIYETAIGKAKEVPAAVGALSNHFGRECEFEMAVAGWRSDQQLLIRVSKTPDDESYEQHFCVSRPRLFVFDLLKNTVRPEGPK
jgi:hypothetical protein